MPCEASKKAMLQGIMWKGDLLLERLIANYGFVFTPILSSPEK